MSNPYDYAHHLAKSIRSDKAYIELMQLEEEMKQNAIWKKMMNDFREQQQNLQMIYMQGEQPSPEQEEKVQQLFTAIQAIPTLMHYLQAEERLGILVQDIQKIVMEPINEIFQEDT
ncbi:YlbF family regulator [Hazenella sp. IB182357]|uniref:YlbF family regulator n=1 Tax=Polycladospora coralii TaxID=2771432 RepID=A0A926NCZ1_9BACL|nr:YlbF family regulator [Polycladospora coralii]MBD1373100.1 YlbF family regulator [Polycladospora coralii]MBS7529555.1 YlbF family regulator [Polycladospora coralii]